MSGAEMLSRGRRALQWRFEEVATPRRSAPAADWTLHSPLPSIAAPAVDRISVLASAAAATLGVGRVLNLRKAAYGPALGWNADPKTGVVAPLSHGKRIDYRDASLVGDIKYLWEPNRHLHVVTLAQAYALTGDADYVRALGRHIGSWIEQCPHPLGPNWASSLEAGIRLINWSYSWRILGDVRSLGCRGFLPWDEWLRSIYQHLHFVTHFYSGHSSANNHLIGEAAGVYVGGLTWPFWPEVARWRTEAREVLIRECERQIAPDGVSREQSTAYQQFVFELLAIPALAARTVSDDMPDRYIARLARMAEFVSAIIDPDGQVPQIGDGDDALVVGLQPDAHGCAQRSLLWLAAALSGRGSLAASAGPMPDRVKWLLAGVPPTPLAAETTDCARSSAGSGPTIRSFAAGGYHVLRTGTEASPAIRAVFDTGPLGYLSIAAHGHADALSILLWIDEREFLIDCGTYSYHAEPEWRDYFRGTSAHNTVTIDGQNQSVSGGNFMWLRHAHARCLGSHVDAAQAAVRGCHDGYHRLRGRPVHEREIAIAASGRTAHVRDRIEGRGKHLVEMFWHFAEPCEVRLDGAVVHASRDGRTLRLEPDRDDLSAGMLRGSERPKGGWISRNFGERSPCSTVVWRFHMTRPFEVTTVMTFSRATTLRVAQSEPCEAS